VLKTPGVVHVEHFSDVGDGVVDCGRDLLDSAGGDEVVEVGGLTHVAVVVVPGATEVEVGAGLSSMEFGVRMREIVGAVNLKLGVLALAIKRDSL